MIAPISPIHKQIWILFIVNCLNCFEVQNKDYSFTSLAYTRLHLILLKSSKTYVNYVDYHDSKIVLHRNITVMLRRLGSPLPNELSTTTRAL